MLGEAKVNRFGNKESVIHHDFEAGVHKKRVDFQENPHYFFDY